MALMKGSKSRTGRFTNPIYCRGYNCGKLFYTEYVNGHSWSCPHCSTVH